MRVFGKTYLVGFGGLNVALIDTGEGLILIDGALPQAADAILANVRRLGFDPRDIRYILSTEPHFDHAGGLAALVRATGGLNDTVEDADRTNSPMSFNMVNTVLLSTPSSFASS